MSTPTTPFTPHNPHNARSTPHHLPSTTATNTSSALPSTDNMITKLKSDLTRARESYIRRERAYKTRIDDLTMEVSALKQGKNSWMTDDTTMKGIKEMQGAIISNVGQVQDRTAKILQEQERDLLRAFRARLFDVQTELEKEKMRTDDGALKWIDKSKRLDKELEWYKDMAGRLDARNQILGRENERLKGEFGDQEEDRKFLIKQLVGVKKDNVRLRQECDKYEKMAREAAGGKAGKDKMMIDKGGMSLESFQFNSPGPATPGTLGRPNTTQSAKGLRSGKDIFGSGSADTRYKEIIKRLKRLLETERRNLTMARERYVTEVRQRTEMEVLLRDCVEDVKGQIKAKKSKLGAGAGGLSPAGGRTSGGGRSTVLGTAGKTSVTVDDFDAAEREKVLELLLSKERILSLLYGKVFPGGGENVHGKNSTNDFGTNNSIDYEPTPEEVEGAFEGQVKMKKGRPGTSGTANVDGSAKIATESRPLTANA